ncbi:MAG: putative short-chain dehydrogenase/reductase [Actinotalea sp.]|nr:putative short-chain dehydrogenase/reductase [Actinotalea sp.]
MSTIESTGPDQRLTGKVVIVTGSAHGIGRAYAADLAERGARIVVADLDGDAAMAVAAEIGSDRAIGVQVDVTDIDACTRLAERTVEAFGRIDVLVNNAALFSQIPISRGGFTEITEGEWDRVMEVNIKGSWLPCVAITPVMIAQGSGSIINISSGTALKGSAGRTHYVASKAAVIGLTKNLARELGDHGIRVNVVAPGNTLSEENPDEETKSRRAGAVSSRALKRLQVPSDLVGVIAFFASDDSKFVTGQTLVVDGGAYMH